MTRRDGAARRRWAGRAVALLMIISASSLGMAASRTGVASASGPDGNPAVDASHHQVTQDAGGTAARLGTGADENIPEGAADSLAARRSSSATGRTVAALARQLLAMWGGNVIGLPGAHSDLLAASRNRAIKNSGSCGKSVRVDIRVLKFLVKVTARYKVKINNIITGHRCDSARHPRGRATDLGGAWDLVTGAATSFGGHWGRDNPGLDRVFVNYISTILPNGSGLGQRNCPGRSNARPRAGVVYFPDSCTHQHIQV